MLRGAGVSGNGDSQRTKAAVGEWNIADSDSIDVTTHGYTRDGIPEPEDVVRMDFVGGFAVQRVNSNRSYVCLIGNIDFKLDFMPPSLKTLWQGS
ncbi:unnamed protein product [Linum tenue]|uniref:Uncharacterized protein n=1 Tax=Linum tenue TaxID=586396 RepID=A0AAV0J017_9ROSI|nr:unnamed protein product [Linum tenue]